MGRAPLSGELRGIFLGMVALRPATRWTRVVRNDQPDAAHAGVGAKRGLGEGSLRVAREVGPGLVTGRRLVRGLGLAQ
jgi:hypothetical protein